METIVLLMILPTRCGCFQGSVLTRMIHTHLAESEVREHFQSYMNLPTIVIRRDGTSQLGWV